MSPVDLCSVEMANCSSGCNTLVNVNSKPLLANTNGSSLAGINVTYTKWCSACSDLNNRPWISQQCTLTSCLNGGQCQQSWSGYKLVMFYSSSCVTAGAWYSCSIVCLLRWHSRFAKRSCALTGKGLDVTGHVQLTIVKWT